MRAALALVLAGVLVAPASFAQILGDQSGIMGGEAGFFRPAGPPGVRISAMPFARTVTCTGDYTLTGTAGAGAVTWSASPSGESGACTGTTSWSCEIVVAPNAVGEGVETITVTQGALTATVDLGFYVDGSHSCWLAQNIDGNYNSTVDDLDAVATWYNLGSSALDVTQATGSAQPTFRTGIVGGQPVVRCDGGDRVAASTASDWTFLSNGTGSTVESVAFTAATPAVQIITGTSPLSLVTDIGYGQAINTTFRSQFYLVNGTSFVINLASANNAVSTSKFDLHTSTIATADTPDFSGYINGTSVISSTPASYSASAPVLPLGICGPSTGLFPLTGDLFRVLIYQSALTSTQRGINKAVDEWALGGTLPVVAALDQAQPNRIVFIGDSITHGSQGVQAWPTKFSARVPFKNYLNAAVSGATAADIRAQFDANCVWPTSTIPGTIIIMGGVNDVRVGTSAASTFATLSSLYAAAAAQGSNIVALTVTPFGSSTIYGWNPTRQIELESLNASIRTASVSQVVDLYPLMGDTIDPQDLLAAYSAADGIHPSEVGSQFIADTVATQMGL